MLTLAKRIERFLASRSLSPEELARKTGDKISGRTVRRILDGQLAMPQVKTWAILARVLKDPSVMDLRERLVKKRVRARGDGTRHLR